MAQGGREMKGGGKLPIPPEERAEKIVDKFWGSTEPTVIDRQMIKAIAAEIHVAEIRAAVEEARLKDFEGDDCTVARLEHEAFAKGRDEAYEDAAKIALESVGPWLAEKIRARAAGVGK